MEVEEEYEEGVQRWTVFYETAKCLGQGFLYGIKGWEDAINEAKICLPEDAQVIALFKHDIRTIEELTDFLCDP